MPARQLEQFHEILRAAAADGSLLKLTLGKYRGADVTLRNVFVRTVTLKSGPHLTFVWRHETRDITKNLPPADALTQLAALIGHDFLDAHLFTTATTAQLECQPGETARLKLIPTAGGLSPASAAPAHDQAKAHLIPASAPWLRALGITNDRGQPREGMSDKFRQIQKFTELLGHLIAESPLPADRPLRVVDMGCGKGYLTFAVASLLGARATVLGIERRPDLVDKCNAAARAHGFANLQFTVGEIGATDPGAMDILIALHACDTATDDALDQGLKAGATLLVVSPCCQKELRAQLAAPAVLADALRHGIFQERQAEFVTDALRAQLLEWAGCRTKVFEFISTEHTAKNLMIAAIKSQPPGDPARAARLRDFAAFYGIRHQHLAALLGLNLSA
ncbi:MAG: SAM-dependent methyltransferase [Opitutaceae bacterium]|nr:SAM-dependent methyltransferase [Opitutaceae bacterium]